MTIQPFSSLLVFVNRRYKRWNRKLTITKRQQFVITTLLLTLGMILTQLVSVEYRYPMVFLISIFTFFLTAFALREDLAGIEWMTLISLPTLFTAAVALFYFLLPTRWLTRIPVAFIYALGIYALLLTENIYNVAAIRTIALIRAAHSIGFLLSLVTFFLLVQSVINLMTFLPLTILIVFVISLVLCLQLLWATSLERRIPQTVKAIAFSISIIISELLYISLLLPINPTYRILFLTVCFYGMSGIGLQYLQDRLYKKTLQEFLIVVAIVGIIFVSGISWR